MGNNSYASLFVFFALLTAGLVLFGCVSQPQAPVQQPVPSPRVCSTDRYLCPDGTGVSRVPANDCQFAACPAPAPCTMEAKLCSDGSYVSRNISKSCMFDACPLAVIPPLNNTTLAAEGENCAGAAGIICQSGLQCIISGQIGADGTCTAPAPASTDLKQCPSERYANCTGEIAPVCGKGTDTKSTFRDYINACTACSTSSNAIGYYPGTCENQ